MIIATDILERWLRAIARRFCRTNLNASHA
jgi:hypothetical protein